MATEKNAPPLIEQVRMLLAAKAEVDAALRDGGTPLLAAAYKGHDACVAALLQHGAYVDAARADGLTPLCQASKAGHTRCVELLLELEFYLQPSLRNQVLFLMLVLVMLVF